MNFLDLSNIALCCIDDVDTDRAIKVLNHCSNLCFFESINLFTSKKVSLPFGVSVHQTQPLESVEDVDNFIAQSLFKFIEHSKCSHVLLVQHDGFILNPHAWTNEFLCYDVIGAPAEEAGAPPTTEGVVRFFNSGFALFSKKLLQAFSEIVESENIKSVSPLDGTTSGLVQPNGINFREKFTELGFHYPSGELASQFSVEYSEHKGSFGYHSRAFQHLNQFKLGQSFDRFLDEHAYKKQTHKFYQIGYKEEHIEQVLPNFEFVLNYPNSIFLEHAAISRIINPHITFDWIGFFPYRVREKLNEDFSYEKCVDMCERFPKADILSHGTLKYGNHITSNPREIHPDMWPVFDKIMHKLGFLKFNEQAFSEPLKMIYTSSFIGKKDILLNYRDELLVPMMDLMQFDDEIYHLSRERSDYGFMPPKELTDISGLPYWTHVPFLLERAISFYCEIKNLEIRFCL
jgi:hypothetical protein